MDEIDPFLEALVTVDHGRLGDAQGGLFHQGFDDEGEGQSLGTPGPAAHGELRKIRHRNAVIHEDLLGEPLVPRQHDAAGITACIGHPQELQVADHVLVVGGLSVELLQEVEGDVGFPLLDGLADDGEVAPDAEGLHLVAHFLERPDDIELHAPGRGGGIDALGDLRWNQVFVDEGQDSHSFHGIIRALSGADHCGGSSWSARSGVR